MSFEEKSFLNKILKNWEPCKKVFSVLLYRGSQDGWNYKNFHDRCDNKGPTITLFEVNGKNKRCGGYTSVNWDCSNTFKSDCNSFLFSLDLKQ